MRNQLIKRLWAIAHSLYGKDKEAYVYRIIENMFKREKIRELSDPEISKLIDYLKRQECPFAPDEWRRIKWLQKKVGWSNEHLLNYIRKYAKVDHPRFLTPDKTRIIISALTKELKVWKNCIR